MFKYKMMIRFFVFLMSLVSMGCNVTADEKPVSSTAGSPEYMKALAWSSSANAEADAQKAIKQKDYRLFVVAGRGERLVGVDAKDATRLKQACGTQYIQGSTDVIKSDAHMAALKKAYAYAEAYNQIMVKHCSA